MKIGLLTFLLSRSLDYEELVDWAGANGFEALEVDVDCSVFGQNRVLLPVEELLSGGKAALAKYTEPLKRNNIDIGSFLSYGPSKLDPDPEVRKKAQNDLKDHIRAASLLGVPVVTTNVGSHIKRDDGSKLNPWGIYFHGLPNPRNSERMREGFEVFAENYLPLAAFAQQNGVKIAFEPAPVGGGAGAVAHSPESFDELFKLADHPALGINFDPSQFVWQGIDYLSYAARLAREKRIFSCHAKDTEIVQSRVKYAGYLSSGWWRFRLPGWGEVNWVELIKTLRDNGYDRVMNLESEDIFAGWEFDDKGRILDIERAKRGCLLGKEYLIQALRIACERE